MDDDGIPSDIDRRVAVAGKIIERAARTGIAEPDVVVDPLVLTVGADSSAASITLGAIDKVRKEFGVNINVGASNVSFGLPDRHTVNQAFLSLAMGKGATCAITDPAKLTGTVRATDLLMGRDNHSLRYLRHYRSRKS
jgi:5-methyltetrahydrofolate--homocysteine methyltransferase